MIWNDFDVLLLTILLGVIIMALMSWCYRRTELMYQLERSTHKRTGSSSAYPFNYPHILIDKNVVDSFEWLKPEDIRLHEEYIEARHSALFNYLNSLDSPVIVPCILLSSKTRTIIDGHHRFSVMRKLGWTRIPVLLLNYQHPDIITHPLRPISKSSVERAGVTKRYLPPKSTQHMIRDGQGNWHPIGCLSLMVEYKPYDHLDTARLRQAEADSAPQLPEEQLAMQMKK